VEVQQNEAGVAVKELLLTRKAAAQALQDLPKVYQDDPRRISQKRKFNQQTCPNPCE
jgi:hypothetical protein